MGEYQIKLYGLVGGSGEQYTEEEIRILLSKMPSTIRVYSDILKEKERLLLENKNNVKLVRARVWTDSIALKDRKKLSSNDDRKAFVEMSEEVQKAEQDFINTQIDYKASEILLKQAENTFTTIRKIANLIEKDQSNVYRENKYGK